jgi:hypothetical protein
MYRTSFENFRNIARKGGYVAVTLYWALDDPVRSSSVQVYADSKHVESLTVSSRPPENATRYVPAGIGVLLHGEYKRTSCELRFEANTLSLWVGGSVRATYPCGRIP